VEVEIIDGEIIGDNDIVISRIVAGALVGILTKTPNYPGAVKIAEGAKAKGCTVVVGGVYATNTAKVIMRHRHKTIDFVVRGFGEKPMLRIVEVTQSGLSFPENRIICASKPSFDEIGWPSREWFDMEQYVANFAADRPSWCIGRGTNLFTHMGCTNRCDFCSRTGPLGGGVYWRDPASIWQEIQVLVSNYSIGYVIDFSDSLTQNPIWLRKLVDARPAELKQIQWYVFSTAAMLRPNTIELLSKLNVVQVFVGAETGDAEVAKNVCKGDGFNPKIVRAGIARLVEVGMRVTPSFVYGLRGETEASMELTYHFAQELIGLSGAEELFASELIPWPGSPAWEMVKEFFGDTDFVEVETLKEVWLRKIIGLDPTVVRRFVDKTLSLARYPISVQGKD
jgi:radical SAM superfamily enzyme YgiQ (UPF0313 family)